VGDRRSEPQRIVQAKERERSRIRDQFGVVLVLLMVTVFFTISAPNAPWAWLATTATLAASLTIAMVASGARKRTVRGWPWPRPASG
jgi:peptidoglycan/LPS O-acetylase OafA/YrhL